MQTESSNDQPETRAAKALVLRGGLSRTFGGLAGFLAFLLLILGVYLLEDLFANPLTAQPTALLAAGFLLGLDAVLFYFLMKPHKQTRHGRAHSHVRSWLHARSSRRHRVHVPGD